MVIQRKITKGILNLNNILALKIKIYKSFYNVRGNFVLKFCFLSISDYFETKCFCSCTRKYQFYSLNGLIALTKSYHILMVKLAKLWTHHALIIMTNSRND